MPANVSGTPAVIAYGTTNPANPTPDTLVPLKVDTSGDQTAVNYNTLSPNNYATGNNAAAIITYNAVAGEKHTLTGIAWSYNNPPSGGNLQVSDGAGNVFFNLDITTSGAGFVPFSPMQTTVNTGLVVTLAAGGVGVIGKVNLLGKGQNP